MKDFKDWFENKIKELKANPEVLYSGVPIPCPRPMCGCKPPNCLARRMLEDVRLVSE